MSKIVKAKKRIYINKAKYDKIRNWGGKHLPLIFIHSEKGPVSKPKEIYSADEFIIELNNTEMSQV